MADDKDRDNQPEVWLGKAMTKGVWQPITRVIGDKDKQGVAANCHRSCFGVYASLECQTNDTQERWQLLLSGQTVKLSGWSHGSSRALSHDQAHVPSPDHDSSPLMTRHVAGPYLPYLSVTLLVGCHTFV